MDDTAKRMKAAMFKAAKYIYWIVGLIVLLGGCYILYSRMERPVAGVLVFISGLLALYFYHVKWFVIPEQSPAWPPVQTVCPDYLTPIAPGSTQSGGTFKCVDFVGVSRNGKLKRANAASLNMQLNDPQYYFEIDPKESKEDLKTRIAQRGLTWVSLFGDN
jgi:hypothetical protein